MLVLTIILAVLNLCLGFTLACYLGYGPAGIVDLFSIFGSSNSKPDSEHEIHEQGNEAKPSKPDIIETANVTEQLPPEPPQLARTESLQQPAEISQPEPESHNQESEFGQSLQYTDEDAISEEMDMELVCNDVS